MINYKIIVIIQHRVHIDQSQMALRHTNFNHSVLSTQHIGKLIINSYLYKNNINALI